VIAEVTATRQDPTHFTPPREILARKSRWKRLLSPLPILTGFLALCVIAMLVIILWNVIAGGIGRLTWEFLSGAPTHGMAEGGIFPAIFGTVFLVILALR
jgi:phosphate transport system permease protein